MWRASTAPGSTLFHSLNLEIAMAKFTKKNCIVMQDLDKPDKLALVIDGDEPISFYADVDVLAADAKWRDRLLVEEGDYGLFARLERRFEQLDL